MTFAKGDGKMKRRLLILCFLLATLAVTGCVPNNGTTRPEDQSVPERVQSVANPFYIALCMTEDPTTSMGINFELPSRQNGFVECRKAGESAFIRLPATLKITDVDGKDLYLYESTLTELEPGTGYEYRVGGENPEALSEIFHFTTEPSDSASTSFILLSDPQGFDISDYMTFATTALLTMDAFPQPIDFAMFTGDMINDDHSENQWKLFLKYAAAFSQEIPMAATTGNHETGSFTDTQIQNIEFSGFLNFPDNGPFYEPFDELDGDRRTPEFDLGKTYSFDVGFAHYVAIDSEIFNGDGGMDGTLDEENMTIFTEWLENDLEQNDNVFTIVFLHRGPYSLHYDSNNVRDRLVPILDAYGVDLVISGHDHRYSRSVYSEGILIPFNRANEYLKGTLSLITDESFERNFNDYSSSLGVTYLVGNSSSVKFRDESSGSGIPVTFEYSEKNAIIPVITVTETMIQITSYSVEKSWILALYPDSVSVLETFIIRP
jgi:hypothetical protein